MLPASVVGRCICVIMEIGCQQGVKAGVTDIMVGQVGVTQLMFAYPNVSSVCCMYHIGTWNSQRSASLSVML